MDVLGINWPAVLAAAIAKSVWGGIWFSPILFLHPWLKTVGMSAEQMRKGMVKSLIVFFSSSLLVASFLALATTLVSEVLLVAKSLSLGALVGGLCWLGLILPFQLDTWSAEKRSLQWLMIVGGAQASGLIIAGAVFGLL